MQGIDVFFAVLSVIAAACAASYLCIFLYRPAAFRFSLTELDALVWYKRVPGKVYLGFALWGLGFMVFKALESALWWMPGTVWIDDSYRPVSWVVAIAIGFGGVNFAASKMEDIARKAASKNET
ncbi:hypothetical protein [Rhodoplanes sp. Z2-YC6860]|uniref:hypothetical protein n=1 Tax=Rhodoplanes sp. Z2-YC6860 TaxID=674703 RepID=UPI00082E7183|nr:hypothetical protein [Rhodoplanes sp. Z2-YC6860]